MNEAVLTPDAIGAIVKARAKLADLPDPSKATAHGLRRGPAQEIAEAGEDPTGQGRWKPGSLTVRKHYVEPAQGEANNTITAMRRKKAEQEQQAIAMRLDAQARNTIDD
ncbi:hypothetical protein ACFVXE_27130 [Streptomyces sp. NPDC058231]|uniref:hypothetical protein n=1 Tax=Streptomyces sp. NPDC058231 TaxID=3346392 RepID=UPI0036E09ACD